MGTKKDIGKVFRERFKDFEESPDDRIWNTIATELDGGSSKKTPLFWMYLGGALLLIVGFSLFIWQPWNMQPASETVVTSKQKKLQEKTSQPETSQTNLERTTTEYHTSAASPNSDSKISSLKNQSGKNDENVVSQNASLSVSKNKKSTAIAKSSVIASTSNSSGNTNYQNSSNVNLSLAQTQNASGIIKISDAFRNYESQRLKEEEKAKYEYEAKIAKENKNLISTNTKKGIDSTTANVAQKDSTSIASKSNKESQKQKKKKKTPKTDAERKLDREAITQYQWAVSPYSSLIRYGSLTKASSIDDRLVTNPRDALNTIGYGIRVESRLSERASIRFGVGVAPLKYQTNDFQVLVNNGLVNIYQLSGIDPGNIAQGAITTNPEALQFFTDNSVVTIEQDISYIEVPLDYQYHIVDKRIGLSISSGVSMFVLTNNNVYAIAQSGERLRVGRESNLNDLSLAFNLGLGAHYNLNKYWRANVEPVFRYQLNPYSNTTGNFRPYYFGAQFGLTYKF